MFRKFLLFCLLLPLICVHAQDIDSAKRQLTDFQESLLAIDRRERAEIQKCGKELLEKGEFETTEQFEKRNKGKEDRCWRKQLDFWDQQGSERREIYEAMNNIIAKQFDARIALDIGTYDADKQMFPIYFGGNFLRNLQVPLSSAKDFKQLFKNALANAKLGLRINASNEAQEYLVNATVTIGAERYGFGTTNLDSSIGMFLMYGGYDQAKKASPWIFDVPSDDGPTQQTVYARVLKIVDFTQAGIEKRILITKTPLSEEGWDCHACAMQVGVSIFSRSGLNWKLDAVYKNATTGGGWGEISAPTLLKIGPERYALSFSDRDMGRGTKPA
jgi:hypothetical protein